MNYPKCQGERDTACRFVSGIRSSTAMHSPIVYNRNHEPVDGGRNVHTKVLSCMTCNHHWICRQTELEELRGDIPKWDILRK